MERSFCLLIQRNIRPILEMAGRIGPSIRGHYIHFEDYLGDVYSLDTSCSVHFQVRNQICLVSIFVILATPLGTKCLHYSQIQNWSCLSQSDEERVQNPH